MTRGPSEGTPGVRCSPQDSDAVLVRLAECRRGQGAHRQAERRQRVRAPPGRAACRSVPRSRYKAGSGSTTTQLPPSHMAAGECGTSPVSGRTVRRTAVPARGGSGGRSRVASAASPGSRTTLSGGRSSGSTRSVGSVTRPVDGPSESLCSHRVPRAGVPGLALDAPTTSPPARHGVDQRRRQLLTGAAAVAQVRGRGLEHRPQPAVITTAESRATTAAGRRVGQHRHPCTAASPEPGCASRLDSWIGSGRPDRHRGDQRILDGKWAQTSSVD